MITFSIALVLFVGGYWVYGRYVNMLFAPDASRKTAGFDKSRWSRFPSTSYVEDFYDSILEYCRFGPIFGAIMGAQFGTASYLWIVFGTIFAGAVHDFLSGTLSLRNGGESLPEIIGRYLGLRTKQVAGIFTVLLMILVGAVFIWSGRTAGRHDS